WDDGRRRKKKEGKNLHRGHREHRVHREEKFRRNPRPRHPPTAGLGQPGRGGRYDRHSGEWRSRGLKNRPKGRPLQKLTAGLFGGGGGMSGGRWRIFVDWAGGHAFGGGGGFFFA